MSLESSSPDEVISEDEAHKAYCQFLDDAAETPGVAVFAWNGSSVVAVSSNDYAIRRAKAEDASLRNRLKTWLGNRKNRLARLRAPSGSSDVEAAEDDLSGFELLMGVAGWPAPMPQVLGVCFLITLDIGAANDDWPIAVVPRFKDQDSRSPAKASRGDRVLTADYQPGTYASCNASLSAKFTAGDTLIEEGGAFVRAGVDRKFGRMVQLVEQRAGNLFRGYEAASQIAWPPYPLGTDDLGRRFGDSDADRFGIGCMAWQAATMLGAAFDTLLLAIAMPGRERREGYVLLPVINLLENHGLPLASVASRPRAQYREAIRDGVRKTILGIRRPSEQNPEEGANRLWRLAGLEFSETPVTRLLVRFAMGLDDFAVTAEILGKLIESDESSLRQGNDLVTHSGGHETSRLSALEALMFSELSKIHDKVLSEAGTEQAILALLAEDDVRSSVSGLWTASTDEEKRGAYDHVLEALRLLLSEQLNGAETARQTVGSLVVDLATSDLDFRSDPEGTFMRRVASIASAGGSECDFWSQRLLEGRFSPRRWSKSLMPARRSFWRKAGDWLIKTFGLFEETPSASTKSEHQNLWFIAPEPLNSDGGALWRAMHAQPGWSGGFAEMALAAVSRAAESMRMEVMLELFEEVDSRFVPDAFPEPLLVPIALDTRIDDDDGIDPFTASFAGIGVLLRDGSLGNAWANACLANVELIDSNGGKRSLQRMAMGGAVGIGGSETIVTVAPQAAAVSDGRRELFVRYSGQPLASYAYRASADEAKSGAPFYSVDWPEGLESKSVLPPLAYGRELEFAVHVIGRSGILPPQTRKDGEPWIPKVDVDHGGVPVAASFAVSRRTAIGATQIADVNPIPRIGVHHGVLPLTSDYPRVVVEPGVDVFLFRGSSGRGLIPLPDVIGEETCVVIEGIVAWEKSTKVNGKLSLSIYLGRSLVRKDGDDFLVSVDDAAVKEVRVSFRRESDRLIQVLVNDRRVSTLWVPLPPSSDGMPREAWLRLSAATKAFSLAMPDISSERAGALRPSHANRLLLLGSKGPTEEGDDWIEPFGSPAKVEIIFPRVVFQDFLRWTSNDSLVSEALESSQLDEGPREERLKRFNQFRNLLVGLDIDRNKPENRDRMPPGTGLIDALPDLAVRAIRLSAAPLDSLVLAPGEMGRDERALLAVAEIEMPSLWSLLESPKAKGQLDERRIIALLEDIDTSLRRSMEVATTSAASGSSGDETISFANADDRGPKELTVPAGLSVLLSARPLVESRHFHGANGLPSVIHERMLDLSLGHLVLNRTSVHVFAGAELTIESMIGPLQRTQDESSAPKWMRSRSEWADDRGDVLGHTPWGSSPDYSLVATPCPEKHWHWRQVGKVTTHTQEWRFTGRPIYSWISPWSYVNPDKRNEVKQKRHAALWLDPSLMGQDKENDHLALFEQELFLGRNDDDSKPSSVSLAPLGHATVLRKQRGNLGEGATLHRHALELQSRYAAAMKDPQARGTVLAWKENDWRHRWARVAILAQRPRLALTRPQLRALLPLTRRPDADQDANTLAPPVLAILQEEPLAHGGLAARVVSEIRTGVGYHSYQLEGEVGVGMAKRAVEPQDARREIGPDPRLSYSALSADAAESASLPAEGPIGLTFDRDADAAAAFPNTGFILHPNGPSQIASSGIEEYFISIGLRRFLDPDWLVPEASDSLSVGNGSGFAVPLDRGPMFLDLEGPTAIGFSDGLKQVLKIEKSSVCVDARAIDPSARKKQITLCRFSAGSPLSLLLIPLDQQRLSVSVIRRSDEDERSGNRFDPDKRSANGLGPVVLASIDLILPIGAHLKIDDRTATKGLRETAASDLTALNWVRTNQDFGMVSTCTGELSLARVPASSVRAFIKDGCLSFDDGRAFGSGLWPRPAQSIARTPTHTQRHTVALLASSLRGRGREIERPLGAYLLAGRTIDVLSGPSSADTVRLVEIETPSRFVAWASHEIKLPEHCRKAHFDLVSVRPKNTQPVRLLFRMRYVGPSTSLAKGATFKTSLTPLGEGVRPVAVPVMECAVPIDAVDFYLVLDSTSQGTLSEVWFVGKNGEKSKANDAQSSLGQLQVGELNAIELSVEIVSPGLTEAWLEVSMLASAGVGAKTPWHFDFDWLFGPNADGVPDVDLSEMPEAQARVVTVSPPIRLDRQQSV
jgi:hypothetical protein